jgi:hypothetical protein
MQRVTSQRHNGTADAAAHAVILVANPRWSPFDRHELMHAASLTLWGEPGGAARGSDAWRAGGWLREGLAAAAENRCGAYTNRGVAAAMHAGGEKLTVADLIERFYELDDLAAYLQAGSLVEYLLDAGGRPAFRRLWAAGPGALGATYGRTANEIDAEWQAWLRATPAGARPDDVAALRRQGCGAGEPPRD